MKQTAIFPGRYVQQEGALRELNEEVARLGTNVLLIAGATGVESIIPSYQTTWSERFKATVERFGGECCDEEIQRLAAIAKGHECDVVIGMGGGKVIDTAKAVGHEVSADVAIVPTIASTDAPTSAVSVIYTSEGAFQRYLFVPRNPDLVLVDTRVIAEAPEYAVAMERNSRHSGDALESTAPNLCRTDSRG
jgi:glycerol dehydrogenase